MIFHSIVKGNVLKRNCITYNKQSYSMETIKDEVLAPQAELRFPKID